jgi:hypothetical protein
MADLRTEHQIKFRAYSSMDKLDMAGKKIGKLKKQNLRSQVLNHVGTAEVQAFSWEHVSQT